MATTNLSSSNQSCEKECREIHDAWERLSHLVRLLACRTQLERRCIRETYLIMYGEDLVNRLKMTEKTNQQKKICSFLSLWMLDPHERDAIMARDALDHHDTDYRALVEIYVGTKSSHILLIKQAYQDKFKSQLEQDIISSEPPHSYQKILIALATSHKSHYADVSQHVANSDARRLYETGEGRPGAIEESVFLELLSKRSIPQLKLTFSTYKHIYGHDYTKSLKKENSGEFEESLRVVVKCMYIPTKYYVKILFKSIKGAKTDESALARVILSRSKLEMDEIQSVFKVKYGMELRDAICKGIPKGDYRDFLVTLTVTPSSI